MNDLITTTVALSVIATLGSAETPREVALFKAAFPECLQVHSFASARAAVETLKALKDAAILAGYDSPYQLKLYETDIKDCENIADSYSQNPNGLGDQNHEAFLTVIREAYQACLDLEKRDEVAARTNALCHRLFLTYKYRQ